MKPDQSSKHPEARFGLSKSPDQPSTSPDHQGPASPSDAWPGLSDSLKGWAQSYLAINQRGDLEVSLPTKDRTSNDRINIKQIVDHLAQRGINPPLVLRFADIIDDRVGQLHEAFAQACEEFDFTGGFGCVYPIKVNHQRPVVEDVLRAGAGYGLGLEVGSKAELLAALAWIDTGNPGQVDDGPAQGPARPIICNGFKDASFIEALMWGAKLGRWIVPVIERRCELERVLDQADEHGVWPRLGIRVNLAQRGAGRWASSGGEGSKFGLPIDGLLDAVRSLRRRQRLECFELLHVHLGSQIHDISRIKSAMNELGRIYVELRKAGANIQTIDVGGGLAVDYDGTHRAGDSSMNYTLAEYANNIVYHLQSVCDEAGAAHPSIIVESGRALVAHHSVLIFEVIDASHDPVTHSEGSNPPGRSQDNSRLRFTDAQLAAMPMPVRTLADTCDELARGRIDPVESFHDAELAREQALSLFNLGFCSLEQRGLAERLFFNVCAAARDQLRRCPPTSEELDQLNTLLSPTYLCNYSIFRSLPDSWAIDQRFPIMPIHRLNEPFTARARLADITCDSDGKIDRYIAQNAAGQPTVGPSDDQPTLELPPYNGEPYLLGAFLVGAYQETLGDLHNLFGQTHAAHVRLDSDGSPSIERIIEGRAIAEVLEEVRFPADALGQSFARLTERAVTDKSLTPQQAATLRNRYHAALNEYPYLT